MILANFLRGKNIRLLLSAFLISFRYCILELRPRLPSSTERKRRLRFPPLVSMNFVKNLYNLLPISGSEMGWNLYKLLKEIKWSVDLYPSCYFTFHRLSLA